MNFLECTMRAREEVAYNSFLQQKKEKIEKKYSDKLIQALAVNNDGGVDSRYRLALTKEMQKEIETLPPLRTYYLDLVKEVYNDPNCCITNDEICDHILKETGFACDWKIEDKKLIFFGDGFSFIPASIKEEAKNNSKAIKEIDEQLGCMNWIRAYIEWYRLVDLEENSIYYDPKLEKFPYKIRNYIEDALSLINLKDQGEKE